MTRSLVFYGSTLLLLCVIACPRSQSQQDVLTPPLGSNQPAGVSANPHPPYQIIATYPHDPDAFTQGLVYFEGYLYESTGRFKKSTLRRVRLDTGEILAQRKLDDSLFGEGITLWKDKIIQLTWQGGIGFVYDRNSFEPIGQFTYPGEGWGICADTHHLWMSDGSAVLRKLDPETFQELSRLPVRERDRPIARLNELEFIKNEIWANIWLTDDIVRIDPQTGSVTGRLTFSNLWPVNQRRSDEAVLNGIAYDAKGDRLFVTGKLWPKLFEIKIAETGQ
ncbi:MAG: glutaminyl-peptide cyclotransferase [Myxococcales bacterium]|nr:glutaminyl-peptide cyclotransferase [Myxococcales bacterium]